MTKKAARVVAHMEVNLGNPNAEADALDALLAGLGVPPADEIIETVGAEEDLLEAAVGELEIESAAPTMVSVTDDDGLEAALDELSALEVIEPEDAPAEEVEAAPVDEKAAKKAARDAEKAARDAEKAARDAEKAAKKAEREAAKEEKPAPVPRKCYASKVERVKDKLGASLGEYTVLTLSDAALTGEELAVRQQETLDILKGAGVKVQNRMTLLLEYCAGKQPKLNEVIARAFKMLHKEGFITVGEKGNFHQDLLAKPYSPAAARAMGNNTLAAMRDFAVIQKDAEGRYVANPESLILMKVNSMLGLK